MGKQSGRSSFSVVIPVHNKARFLETCVGSILAAAEHAGGAEIILVENGSSDGSDRIARRLAAHGVTTITSNAATAGRARNDGVVHAAGEVLCFLDADVVVPLDYFVEARRIFGETWVSAAGCTVELPVTAWIERVWGQLHAGRTLGLNRSLNGANLCVRKDVFGKAGGFDGSLMTGEDADLCLRLVEAGETLLESPALSVVHLDNPRTPGDFFRKEAWHGLGAFATARRDRLDKPLFLTMLYATLLVGALVMVIAWRGTAPSWFLAIAMASGVPVMTVVYRWTLAKTPTGFIPGVALYHIYFLARSFALVRILLGTHRVKAPPGGLET